MPKQAKVIMVRIQLARVSWIAFTLLLICAWMPAQASDDHVVDAKCQNLLFIALKTPETLILKHVPRYHSEVVEAGVIYDEHWKPARSNENYLYLIDTYGNIWVTPQYLRVPYEDPFYMATHRSIYNRMLQVYEGKDQPMPGIIAAGQMGYRYGEASRFDNRSGGFRGGPEHLEFALNLFRPRGHKFHSKLNTLDFSRIDKNATGKKPLDPEENHMERKEILESAHNPVFQSLRDRWKGLMIKLYERFPDEHRAGIIDEEKVVLALYAIGRENRSFMDAVMLGGQFLPLMNESLDFVTFKSAKSPAAAETMIRNFEYMLDQTAQAESIDN